MNATFWKSLALFLGTPVRPKDGEAQCCKCHTRSALVDLGDGDYICEDCWRNHIPSYRE